MAKLSDADVAKINQQLAADPEWQALVTAAKQEQIDAAAGRIPWGDFIGGNTPVGKAYQAYIKKHNIPLGPGSGNNARIDNGQITLNHPYKTFAKEAAISAGIMGGGALALNALAAPAAVGGSSTLGAAGPLSADEVFTAGPVAGGGISGVEGGGALAAGAAAKTPSLLHDLLPTIIGAGANLAGTGIAAHANTEAAKIAAEQADKALALQKEQYALQRQDTAPARALAQGAIGNLGFLSGIDYQKDVPALSATVPTTPYGQAPAAPQGPSLATLGQPAQQSSGLVSVKNPATGLVHLIPQNQVAEAQQHGGVVV